MIWLDHLAPGIFFSLYFLVLGLQALMRLGFYVPAADLNSGPNASKNI